MEKCSVGIQLSEIGLLRNFQLNRRYWTFKMRLLIKSNLFQRVLFEKSPCRGLLRARLALARNDLSVTNVRINPSACLYVTVSANNSDNNAKSLSISSLQSPAKTVVYVPRSCAVVCVRCAFYDYRRTLRVSQRPCAKPGSVTV